MTQNFGFESPHFQLSLCFRVGEPGVPRPSLTVLSVFVQSDGFSASTTMDVDIKDILAFFDQLQALYQSLSGEARIQESFGYQQYLLFSGNRTGHLFISGKLHANGEHGFCQELRFENATDQSFIPQFIGDIAQFMQNHAQYRT